MTLNRVLVVFVMCLSTGLVAQQREPAPRSQSEAAYRHEIADLLQASREQCDLAMAALQSLAMAVEKAKKTTDPVQLRAVVTEMNDPLREAKQHAGSCGDIIRLAQHSLPLSDDHDHGTSEPKPQEEPPPPAAEKTLKPASPR